MQLASWNALQRRKYLTQAADERFDLIIIGGGITGAGIAREAALRGLSFCLLDKNDFAFGTSSRSSKLVHGGLRYLAQGELGLVRESTTERNWLMSALPNLVRPLGFMLCSYEHGKESAAAMQLALRTYDQLSNRFSRYKNYRTARFFCPELVEEMEPAVARWEPELGRLTAGGLYYDANVDDARLTIETIKESIICGGGRSVALNYAEVSGIVHDKHGKACAVSVCDQLDGLQFDVQGQVIISSTGIWTDQVMGLSDLGYEQIYPTKGVHLVVDNRRLGNQHAFGVRSFDDGRFFFILRRGQCSVIGTTDTDYYAESHELDRPWCTARDADYLLRTVNRLFPQAELTHDDIIGTYAGIRPLIRQQGVAHASSVSRQHKIFHSPDGVVAITGGKLTTFRLMAEQLLFYLVEHGFLAPLRHPHHRMKGFSKRTFQVAITQREFEKRLQRTGLHAVGSATERAYLHQQYGTQALAILETIQAQPDKGRPLIPQAPLCPAEIEFILANENAPRLIDVLCRRTEAQWSIPHAHQQALAEKTAALLQGYYGWQAHTTKAEIGHYLDYIAHTMRLH